MCSLFLRRPLHSRERDQDDSHRFYNVSDPVVAGLVDCSLPRPGGSIAGFTTIMAVLAGKQLGLLRRSQSYLVLLCCGIHRLKALHSNGKPARGFGNSVCNFIPWR